MIRLSLASLLCIALCAQTSDQTPQPSVIGRGGVTEILVPVTVHDRDGNLVNGIQPREFHLTDNTKDQDITADVTFHPISLAIVIQANAAVEAILPQVRRIGAMLESMIVGDQGEACVLAFDHRLQLKQDFTNDVTKISEALKKINPGSSTSRVRDAMGEGIRLLGNRPKERRRVLLIIAETRDYGSEGKMKDVVLDAQFKNVIVYTVNMSRMVATLTNKPYPQPGGMASLPPAAQSMPSNVPATPNTIMQKGVTPGSAADAVPLIVEILRDVKAVFVDNPAEKMTKATGGQEFSFFKQKGLEDAIAKIGQEIHSQYLITYTPNNKDEGGWHDIRVTVSGRTDLKVRSRPGYWVASSF